MVINIKICYTYLIVVISNKNKQMCVKETFTEALKVVNKPLKVIH